MANKTVTTTLTCVDAKVTTNDEIIRQGKRYKGSFEYQDDDHVRFVEESDKVISMVLTDDVQDLLGQSDLLTLLCSQPYMALDDGPGKL